MSAYEKHNKKKQEAIRLYIKIKKGKIDFSSLSIDKRDLLYDNGYLLLVEETEDEWGHFKVK